MDESKYDIVKSILTRKVVKGMLMPVIYGQTVGKDIKKKMIVIRIAMTLLHFAIAFVKYKEIVNLMKLLNVVPNQCSIVHLTSLLCRTICVAKQRRYCFMIELPRRDVG